VSPRASSSLESDTAVLYKRRVSPSYLHCNRFKETELKLHEISHLTLHVLCKISNHVLQVTHQISNHILLITSKINSGQILPVTKQILVTPYTDDP